MAISKKASDIRKTGFLTTTTSDGTITNLIAPNGLQVGLSSPEFQNPLVAIGGVRGSLTKLVDGTSYLIAGDNISVVTGSTGAITISATGFPSTALLSNGNGIAQLSYNGQQAATVSLALSASSGLALSNLGISVSPKECTAQRPAATADRVLVSQGTQLAGYRLANVSVGSILSLGTSVALTNKIKFGDGIRDASAQNAGDYDNTQPVTMSLKTAANGGLSLSTSGIAITPNTVGTSISAASTDVLLIAQATTNYALRKVTAQSIADLATVGTLTNGLTIGIGLAPAQTIFDGSSGATVSVLANGPTINVAAAGLSVAKVPNVITGAKGIKSLSFDGSAVQGIELDLLPAGGLAFSNQSLILNVEDLPAGVANLTHEVAISLGNANTRKVDLSEIRTLFNTGPVVINGMLQVTGSLETTGVVIAKSGLSGSLTRLIDGTSYIVAGPNVTVVSESNGQITISSTTGADSAGFFTSDTPGFLTTTGSTSFAGGEGVGYKTSDAGSDVIFFVSGSTDSKDSSTRGTAVFGGDVVVSGTLYGGSPLRIAGGAIFNEAGSPFATFRVETNTKTHGFFINSDTEQVFLLSGSGVTGGDGYDVAVFVSGSVGSRQTLNRGVTLFGGDTVVSGTIAVAQNISGSIIKASSGFSGSLTTLADGNPYLIAGANITMATGALGAVTITSTATALTFKSGSTTIPNIDNIDISKLGIMQNLGAGDIAITGSIGVPEDGSYSDGLFIDFKESTPVGTAVDRFNEVLKGLAPSAAPNLDDMDCSDSGTAAELSFGSSQSIAGYTNAQPSTLTPTDNLSDVDINGAYTSTISSNDQRVACFAGSTTIDGTLNADVSADSPNYAAYSFGDGDQGTLKLFVNNNSVAVHSVDLSSFGSGTSLNGNGSGFILSATTPSHFSDGSNFATFQHRQGTYLIHPADQRNGWNYVRVVHTIGGTDRTCNYAEWVNDPDSNALSSAGSAFNSLSMTGTKNLSGVKYNTGGSAQYRVRVSNAYRNTYSTSNITFNGTNCSVSSQAFPVINHGAGEDETKVLHLTGSTTVTGDPILNGSISVSTNVPSPLKSDLNSAGSQSISGILLYNLSDTSTSTSETFRGESYRLISGSYDTQATVSDVSNAWSSTTSLLTVDGLMFYNSRLYAPVQGGASGDFRNTGDGGSITNGPGSNVNYSSVTSGRRTFLRYITNTSGGSQTNFSLTINGSGTIVSQGTSLSTGNISVLLKLPTTTSAFSTGWMDLAVAFATGQTDNGAGCLNGSFDSSLNATNNATFGTQSVASGEYVMVKIEADAAFTGHLRSLSVSWG